MKKLTLFFAIIFMIAAFISCDKRNQELRIESMPEYTGTAILAEPALGPGGNISCEELDGEYVFSSGRINFVNGTFDFSDANTTDWPEGIDLVTGWPNGLSVTVSDDGRFLSFNFTSDNYCIGAVIVKGGNASNVYTYDPAVKSDANLSAPVNASGLPAGLSNLTFCFVECRKEEELKIAVKIYYSSSDGNKYGVSKGAQVFTGSQWCATYPLGINSYPSTPSFEMFAPGSGAILGEVKVENGDVTLTLNKGLTLITAYMFIGTQENLQNSNLNTDGCPWYTNTAVWKRNATPGIDANGLSFMFFDL